MLEQLRVHLTRCALKKLQLLGHFEEVSVRNHSHEFFWHKTCVFLQTRTGPMINKIVSSKGARETIPQGSKLAGPPNIQGAGRNDTIGKPGRGSARNSK